MDRPGEEDMRFFTIVTRLRVPEGGKMGFDKIGLISIVVID
jgi:hypothetical protein